ncbi:hypothetical protein [Actinomadura terrae]|uniref:hypothetical protein n=1 Tax=Actinomadura terrae TaxID=604353 RepID=UPI001FA74E09|nr:hypothetical protein [Actinomadura terrae]
MKSEDSDRHIIFDQATADVLKAWLERQLEERLAWCEAWTDSGRLAAGVDLKVVSEILGHASAAFTADVAESLAEDAAAKISAFGPRRNRV